HYQDIGVRRVRRHAPLRRELAPRWASASPSELTTHNLGPASQRPELAVAHVAWTPAEAAIRRDVQLLRADVREHRADVVRHVLGRFGVERLHVDHPRAQLAALAITRPEIDLG